MKIIGFGHRKRVGKDQATMFALNYLKTKHPKIHAQRGSFFSKMKDIAQQMYSWGGLEDELYYENHPEMIEEVLPAIGRSPRQIWNELGVITENICPWTLPELALASTPAETDLLIFKDLRRPAEVEYIRKFGGVCFRIDRDVAPVSNHRVDTALASFDGWDAIIKNNGTLRELNDHVKSLVEKYITDWGLI